MRLTEKIAVDNGGIFDKTIRDAIQIVNSCGYYLGQDELDFLPSTRLSALGYFSIPKTKSDKPKIYISPNLKKDRDVIINTVLHEIAHYLSFRDCMDSGRYAWDITGRKIQAYMLRGGPMKPHGVEWKTIAKKLGNAIGQVLSVTGTMADFEEGTEQKEKTESKYIFECEKCGQKLFYNRRTNFVQTYDQLLPNGKPRWRCGICDGKFKKIKG